MSVAAARHEAHVEPVFVMNSKLPACDQKSYSTTEICKAAEKVCGYESMIGAQRIVGLWRIYPTKREHRDKILVHGITLRGIRVTVRDQNPYVATGPDGTALERPSTKVIIGNIPLSFADEEIVKAMQALGCELRSNMSAERDRDEHGKLTRWKTGRRFMYIALPAKPLPKTVQIGPFKASVYHREQKLSSTDTVCSKCLQKGHRFANCPNPVKCRQCFKDGHMAGDVECNLTPDDRGPDTENKTNEEERVIVELSCQSREQSSSPRRSPKPSRGRSRPNNRRVDLGAITRREGSAPKRPRPASDTRDDAVSPETHRESLSDGPT